MFPVPELGATHTARSYRNGAVTGSERGECEI